MKKHNTPILIGIFAVAVSIVLNRFCDGNIADFLSGFFTGIGLTGIFYGLWLNRKKRKNI